MGLKEALGKVMEVVPTASEIGAELGNRVTEAKGFLGKVLSDCITEVTDHQIAAGAHELSAALLRGSDGFVMYERSDQNSDRDQPTHGLPSQAQVQPEAQQERGMEMER